MASDRTNVLSTGDVARIYGVDAKTISRWVMNSLLVPDFRTPAGHARWYRTTIDNLKRDSVAGRAR